MTQPNKPLSWNTGACIGRTVKILLLDRGLTAKQLAAALHVTPVAVGRRIRGETEWSSNDLMVTASFLDIDARDLLPVQNPDWSPGDDETFRWLPAPVKPPTSRRIQR